MEIFKTYYLTIIKTVFVTKTTSRFLQFDQRTIFSRQKLNKCSRHVKEKSINLKLFYYDKEQNLCLLGHQANPAIIFITLNINFN